MQPIELVVFDMAGTTVTDHHEVERCFAEAATQTGLSVTDERILAMQGLAKRYVFETLWKEQLGDTHPDVQSQVDVSYAAFKDILEHHYLTNGATPTEGCLETLAYLRERGIAVALTTGFYRVVTDIILDKLGWLADLDEQHRGGPSSIIQVSIASDEVERGRPYPQMIERAMQLLNVTNPKAVVNIGDTPSDLLSGRAAGVALNIGITNGTHTADQLDAYPHDLLIGSLRELPALIRQVVMD
ncbi:HAD family hydrolase [Spirosoma utsteinense]|uniref:Phosphonatase-like hydrolase n=1 Tax=Spirosoma utsteinense TaxID=2585773 RepID=A0ABR6VZW4_9BACT|nr:HAD family hydrolase [Spirosoma utsteinense]MBC3786515.1 phosphonatase-like hydrolase [Spirosoma utsteinense]MBC3789891.1 phosphonatase-like hydrolase [Spirosoma utsteinense]